MINDHKQLKYGFKPWKGRSGTVRDGQGLWCHESQIIFFTVYRQTPCLEPGTTYVFRMCTNLVPTGAKKILKIFSGLKNGI